MKYYKIMNGSTFIGAINSNDFVAKNPKNGWLLTSNEILGQFIDYNGQLYRDYWMQPIPNNTEEFILASVIEINQEEYNILIEAIINNEPIENEEEEEEEPQEIVVPEEPDELLEYVRNGKITEMSRTCRNTIEAGFDIELSDGEIHHFSLDTQDQLNLITLSALAETQELIPYHADGEICKFYSAAEIKAIVAGATQFKMYHTTYYNALKAYINSLETIEEIAAVTYGMELPEEFQSDVLKAIS